MERERLVFSPRYNPRLEDLGIHKPFALDRGQQVLDHLAHDLGRPTQYTEPAPITREHALLVHTERYLDSLLDERTWVELLELDEEEYFPERAIKPLTTLFDDFMLKCGGTLLAANNALRLGRGVATLGGGYHHAFPDQGRGFCALHDVAIAIRSLQREGRCRKVMVIDLDFHQGDGTALIFRGDADVLTLSVHSEEGWPDEKQSSDVDVPIRSADTHLYMDRTREAVEEALRRFPPDLVMYVAGSDPYELDVLPGSAFIKLPLNVMRQRDEYVIGTCAQRGIPLAMVFAGGYGPHVWEVHYYAVRYLLGVTA